MTAHLVQPTLEPLEFNVGDRVEKLAGDYHFRGEIRAAFHTKEGKARYVVEPDVVAMQLIYSAKQLRSLGR